MRTLSKSDFKAAQDCPSKLYYRELNYPNTLDEDEYLQLLAEGGYAVGKMATLQHPGGHDLSAIGSPEEAVRRTQELLAGGDVIIYEAAVQWESMLVRIDILIRKGQTLELIEVKSKSWNSTKPDFKPPSEWKEYIDDVAFQAHVVQSAHPSYSVVPFLLMPDKAKRTTIEGLNSWFEIQAVRLTGAARPKFRKIEVKFVGNEEALQRDDILAKVPMAAVIAGVLPNIALQAARYRDSLNPDLVRITEPLTVKCASCEYRIKPQENNGFRECWRSLADSPPDILDLYQLGNVNRKSGSEVSIDDLISQGRVRLTDYPAASLDPANLEKPYYNNRPFMHLTLGAEWTSPELIGEVRNLQYPLHFIDFETSRMALPYHKGMRPYENVAFQWSLHTMVNGTADPEHKEWINTVDVFPNFDFAKSLRDAIGDAGTVLMWSHHEQTVLRDIQEQMEEWGRGDADLLGWLQRLAGNKEKGLKGRLVDMNRMAVQGYFHPATKAKTSIKKILPAVLSETASPRIRNWLRNFETGLDLAQPTGPGFSDPYWLLPDVAAIDGYSVQEGTAAMRAYQDILYGAAQFDETQREAITQALLRYCKLDTFAMVIIWEHWRTRDSN